MFSYRFFVPVIPLVGFYIAVTNTRFKVLAGVALAANLISFSSMMLQGINFVPIKQLGPLGPYEFEYSDLTPKEYGEFIQSTIQTAERITSHWDAQDREDVPTIFLFTGGTGYFLPEFYVYEALVGYRHACRPHLSKIIEASDYIQEITGVPYGRVIARSVAQRHDNNQVDVLVENPAPWGSIRYWFGPQKKPIKLPSRIDLPCPTE